MTGGVGEFHSTVKETGKEEYLYSAILHQGAHKALRHGSHSFTCKQHHACLSFVSIHQMAPPQQLTQQTSICSLLLIYRPRKDERLSWPGWLTSSGWFTHLSGHPSATGRAQDSESTPAKDWRYTAGPRNQPTNIRFSMCKTPCASVCSRRLFIVSVDCAHSAFPVHNEFYVWNVVVLRFLL